MSSFANDLQIEAQFLAEKFNLLIYFKGFEAKTDGKVIWLPALPDKLDEKISRIFRGFLAHEVAHCRYTDWEVHNRKVKSYQSLAQAKNASNIDQLKAKWLPILANLYEDPFVDRSIIKDFEGCAKNILHQNRFFKELFPPKKYSFWDQFLLSLYYLLYHWDKTLYPELDPYQQFEKDIVDFVNQLLTEEIKDHLTTQSTAENYLLAERTFNKIQQYLEKPPEEEQFKNHSSEEVANFMPEEATQAIEQISKEKAVQGYAKQQFTYIKQLGRPLPYTTEYDTVTYLKKTSETDFQKYQDLLLTIQKDAHYLREQFLATLRAKTQKHWKRQQEVGKLDTQRLVRAIVNPSAIRLYKTKDQGLQLKTAVTILIDASGSMNPIEAQTVLVALAEPLAQLNIPTEIISFTTKGHCFEQAVRETKLPEKELLTKFTRFDHLYFEVYKTFRDRFREVKYRLSQYKTFGFTPIFEAIDFAAKRLYFYNPQTIQRRILFVITDGLPQSLTTEYHLGLMFQMILEKVKLYTGLGIEICGIGLRTPFVSKVFPDSVVTETADYGELARKLIAQLRNYF